MQNVLKSKIWIQDLKLFLIFPTKSYVLDHSESIAMHIEKLWFELNYGSEFKVPQKFSPDNSLYRTKIVILFLFQEALWL